MYENFRKVSSNDISLNLGIGANMCVAMATFFVKFYQKQGVCFKNVFCAGLEINIYFGNRKYLKLPHIPLECRFLLTPGGVLRNHHC